MSLINKYTNHLFFKKIYIQSPLKKLFGRVPDPSSCIDEWNNTMPHFPYCKIGSNLDLLNSLNPLQKISTLVLPAPPDRTVQIGWYLYNSNSFILIMIWQISLSISSSFKADKINNDPIFCHDDLTS